MALSLNKNAIDDAGRIHLAYQATLGRSANEKEHARAVSYLADYEADARKEGVKDVRTAAWASFSQALLASAEFRYIR